MPKILQSGRSKARFMMGIRKPRLFHPDFGDFLKRRRDHSAKIKALVRIEMEDPTVNYLDVFNPRAPAMKLDHAHLDAGHEARRRIDKQVRLVVTVLFADRDVLYVLAKAARVVLLLWLPPVRQD